ncbi:MAG: cache domain-containing protein [Oscillospiraceae bacterium]
MKELFRKNRIYTIFFFSMLIMLILPIALFSIVYYQTAKVMEEEIQAYNHNLLTQCSNRAESVFEVAENVLTTLSFHPAVIDYVKTPNSYEGSSQLYKAQQLANTLKSYSGLGESIGLIDLQVYANRTDSIVSIRFPYSRMEYLTPMFHLEDDGAVYSGGRIGGLQYLPEMPLVLFDNTYDVIVIQAPILSDYHLSEYGKLILILDTQQFSTILNDMNLGDTGFARISEADGTLLKYVARDRNTALSELEDADSYHPDYLGIQISNALRSRTYSAFVPKDLAFSKIGYIKTVSYVTSSVGIVLCILFAAVMAYRNTKPVKEIFHIIEESHVTLPEGQSRRDYKYIRDSLSNIISSRQKLETQLASQILVARSDLVRRIIEGNISDRTEIQEYAGYVSCNFSGKKYSLLSVRTPEPQNAGSKKSREKVAAAFRKDKILIKEFFSANELMRSYSY